MRKLLVSILVLVAIFASLNSCKKDYSNETYTLDPPTKPDLATKLTASVSGFITDENDKAVEGALVTAGTQSISSDKYGYFKISNASLSKTAGFIKVTKPGYFNGFRTFVAKEGKETFTRLKLIPKINTGTINSASGGTVTTTDGSSVTLPANAVVIAANGNAYTGTINIATHLIDPTSNDIALNIPGSLMGIDTAGYLKVLQSYGMLAVELTDASGNLLQIANGKEATLNFPIPATLTSSAPATIPLWSLDEMNGLWKEESAATKTGNNYTGNVKHFSYWNCDIGYSPVSFTVQIVDSSLHPLENTFVSVRGDLFSSYNHGYTDTAGFMYGMVPANADLNVNVLTPCGSSAFSKNFSTNTTAVDLGSMIADLKQNKLTINGQVLNCNNAAVTNGSAIAFFNGCNNISLITNGSFTINTTACTNPTSVSVLAFDLSEGQESEVKTVTVNAGTNNVGTLIACNVDTSQFVRYTIDVTDTVITIPPNKVLMAQNKGDTVNTIYIQEYATQLQIFGMDFTGGATIGNSHVLKSGGVMLGRKPYYSYNGQMIINITQYDVVGGFIIGSFGGLMQSPDNIVHIVDCSFKVRRLQ